MHANRTTMLAAHVRYKIPYGAYWKAELLLCLLYNGLYTKVMLSLEKASTLKHISYVYIESNSICA